METKRILFSILLIVIGLNIGFTIGRSPYLSSPPAAKDKSMAVGKMTAELGSNDQEFDLRFINNMIAHHEGAIDMASQAQQNSNRPEIQNLANEIIAAQSQEIEQMKQWKGEWYDNR